MNIIIPINILIFLAIIFSMGRDASTYALYSLPILAVIALMIYWYKNIVIHRLLLALYVSTILVAIKELLSLTHFPLSSDMLLFYGVLVVVGIYTTFCTRAGFVGVIGDNEAAIRTASLWLLAVVIIVTIIIVSLGTEGEVRAVTPTFVIMMAYNIFNRQALSFQHNDEENGGLL